MQTPRAAVIVNQVTKWDEFALEQLQEECQAERPAYVTRVVNALVKEGILAPVEAGRRRSYRWRQCRQSFSTEGWLRRKRSSGTSRLSDTPASERPRERLMTAGAASLRTAELLAILIRSGRPGESALQAGERIANQYSERMEFLPQAGCGELSAISPAVKSAVYCQIMAGIELGRRIAAAVDQRTPRTKISAPSDAIDFCCQYFSRLASDASQEEFHIVCLSTKHEVMSTHQITVGTLDASLVHPREVFRPAIKDAAASVILVHNHPSGDPTPSDEDISVTMRLEEAGNQLGISILDHVVLGRRQAVSIRQYLEGS